MARFVGLLSAALIGVMNLVLLVVIKWHFYIYYSFIPSGHHLHVFASVFVIHKIVLNRKVSSDLNNRLFYLR